MICMIEYSLFSEDIEKSKRVTTELDSNKAWNKFECKNNYIGFLGELFFDKYLRDTGIEGYWLNFVEDGKGWNDPDFIINDKTVDVKTTYSNGLWFQKPKFDVYVYVNISRDNSKLNIVGFVTKEYLEFCIRYGLAKKIKRGNRIDYVLDKYYLNDIGQLGGECDDK